MPCNRSSKQLFFKAILQIQRKFHPTEGFLEISVDILELCALKEGVVVCISLLYVGRSNAAFIVADICCSNIWLLEDCSGIRINLASFVADQVFARR